MYVYCCLIIPIFNILCTLPVKIEYLSVIHSRSW